MSYYGDREYYQRREYEEPEPFQAELIRIDVLSLAKIMGIIGAIFGFIEGVILATATSTLMRTLPVAAMPTAGSTGVTIVAMTIFGAIGGFIGAAIFAIVYNFVAERFGGAILEFLD